MPPETVTIPDTIPAPIDVYMPGIIMLKPDDQLEKSITASNMASIPKNIPTIIADRCDQSDGIKYAGRAVAMRPTAIDVE